MSLSADERLLLLVGPSALVVARLSIALPIALAGLAVAIAVASAQKRLVVLALLVLISARADSVRAELIAAPTRPVTSEWVELTTDPRPTDFGWRAEVISGEHRLRLEATGGAIRLGADSAVGDHLLVSGVIVGTGPGSDWELSRRLVGTFRAQSIDAVRSGTGPKKWATTVRDVLRSGADGLERNQRALFTGLVFGDDREQDSITADNFRAAGLGHLLAVSGQNVLFVLVLAAPVLSRIDALWIRLGATLLVLAAFGFLTRFEPSVSRALVMAAIAAVTWTRGAPMGAVRVLPAAIVLLLLIDPLLAFSLAFQLSVAATIGLVVISPRIESHLAAAGLGRSVIAATLGAQLAVAPLLISNFGSVSLLAVPANVLAAPAAAFVMVWGLTAGFVAAAMPAAMASVIHLPTRGAIWWIEQVARTIADVPTGSLRGPHIAVLAFAIVAAAVARRGPWFRLAVALGGAAIVAPLLLTPPIAPGRHQLGSGIELVRSSLGHDIVILDRSGGTQSVLENLRVARVGRIDLLITRRGDRGAGRVVRTIGDRFDVTDVWAPSGHHIPGARVAPEAGGSVGPLLVDVEPDGSISVTEAVESRG